MFELLTEKEVNIIRKRKANILFTYELSNVAISQFSKIKIGNKISIIIKERGNNKDNHDRKCNKYYYNEYLNYTVIFKNSNYFQIGDEQNRISIMLNDLIDNSCKIINI